MRIALLFLALLVRPAFGGECFCLVAADDAVWFDCREQNRPLRTEPLVFCTDTASGKQVELTGRQDLVRVADGDPPCTPCRLSDAADLDHTIRGDTDEQKAPPATATQRTKGEDWP